MSNKIEIKSIKDIPIGAILETGNGTRWIYMGSKFNTPWEDFGFSEFIAIKEDFCGFQTFKDDLSTPIHAHLVDDNSYKIKKVFVGKCDLDARSTDLELVWEREEKPQKKSNKSKFNRGDKFEIEISEVHTHYDDNGKPFSMYRAKGFSTLTFDDKSLERLKKIESEEWV